MALHGSAMTDQTPPPDPAKIVRIVDVETSGLPEDENHAICEIGWVDLELATMRFRNPTSFLVNPGHPIPPHIRAVHHISDQMVADAVSPDAAVARLLSDLGDDDALCAHSAKFERAFVETGSRRWVCTLKAAWRAWPDFRSYGNQPLRYELGIDNEPDFPADQAMPPHRALPDAWVTASILRRLLNMRPLARLVEIEQQPGFLPRFSFGRHIGKTFKEVAATDAGYLSWIIEKSDLDEDCKFTARWHLDRRAA